MQKIWKYELPWPLTDIIDVKLPRFAQVLDIEMQSGQPYMWAAHHVESEDNLRTYQFAVVGTGHERDEDDYDPVEHIKTLHIPNLNLVLHFFALGEA